MRFAILLMLLVLSTGCKLKPSAPSWPSEVKSQFAVVWDENGEPFCFSYEILSTEPYVLGEPIQLNDARACQGLTGYLPLEMAKVIRYKNQVLEWAEQSCKGK